MECLKEVKCLVCPILCGFPELWWNKMLLMICSSINVMKNEQWNKRFLPYCCNLVQRKPLLTDQETLRFCLSSLFGPSMSLSTRQWVLQFCFILKPHGIYQEIKPPSPWSEGIFGFITNATMKSWPPEPAKPSHVQNLQKIINKVIFSLPFNLAQHPHN